MSQTEAAIDQVLSLARESVTMQRKLFMQYPNVYHIVEITKKHPNDLVLAQAAKLAINFIENAAKADNHGCLTRSKIVITGVDQIIFDKLFSSRFATNPNDKFIENFKISRSCEMCSKVFDIQEDASGLEKTYCIDCEGAVEMRKLLDKQRAEIEEKRKKIAEKKTINEK